MGESGFPVVVIGASAGGVQALMSLVEGLPVPFEAAVLIVLHIPPDFKSELATILQQVTSLRVVDAADRAPLERGSIYVAAAGHHLLVTPTSMRLTRTEKEARSRPAIDALFRSAADAFGKKAIGVVLSGMLTDGTSGLGAIKDQGGIALVQSDPCDTFASMPENAAYHVDVDASVPVASLGPLIGQHVARLASTQSAGNAIIRSGIGSSDALRVPSTEALLLDADNAIDRGLWGVLHAVDERVVLLRRLAQQAKDGGSGDTAKAYLRQAEEAIVRSRSLREMVTDSSLFGHAT